MQAPPDFKPSNLHDFRVALNQAVLADMHHNKENVINPILNVELMNKSSIYQFQVSVCQLIMLEGWGNGLYSFEYNWNILSIAY